jgi:hypothetical protein
VQIGNQVHEKRQIISQSHGKYRHGPEQIALSILVCSLPCMDTVQLPLVDKIVPGVMCIYHQKQAMSTSLLRRWWFAIMQPTLGQLAMKLTDGDWQRQKNVLFVTRKTTSLQDQLRHTQ